MAKSGFITQYAFKHVSQINNIIDPFVIRIWVKSLFRRIFGRWVTATTMAMVMPVEVTFLFVFEWTKQKKIGERVREAYEKHSKCMFTRPLTILFAIVHFNIDSQSTIHDYRALAWRDCWYISLWFLFFSFWKKYFFFQYIFLPNM